MDEPIIPSTISSRATGNPVPPTLRVTLNFHPDAPFSHTTTIDALRATQIYKSQFETRTSNGGLTAFPGGDRWEWENQLFGGFYDHRPLSERPKYGALDFRSDVYGASPRFGSCYFRLNAATLERTTFCFPDSAGGPTEFGTAERCSLIELAERRYMDDPLNWYIEAHVHGILRIPEDVEAVVLDPSYRGTGVEEATEGLGCVAEWHPGYRVSVEELEKYPEYRGKHIIDVARNIARDGLLDPHILGLARRDPTLEWGDLKKVWHYLARYGRQNSWQVAKIGQSNEVRSSN